VLDVAFGDNLSFSESDRSIEPDRLVAPRNRIVREKLMIDVTFPALGVVYRRDFGILLVYAISGNLEYYDPLLGILVAVELTDVVGSRLRQHESFDGAFPATNADVTNDGRLHSIHPAPLT
jgi:hypothetical protein